MTGKREHQAVKESTQDNRSDDATGSLLSSSSTLSSSSSSVAATSLSRRRQRRHELELPLPLFNFSIPAESVAQVFFFRHYSIAGSSWLYAAQGAAARPTLKMLGIMAVGMAGLANSERDGGIMALARAKYGSTLHSINDAIKVRAEATKESTLAAVVLMGMFEVMMPGSFAGDVG